MTVRDINTMITVLRVFQIVIVLVGVTAVTVRLLT